MAGSGRRNADEALALALASGKTVRDAAAELGIGERTAARRLVDLAFRARVNELRGEMVSRALGRMADGMTEAADTLRGLLHAESEAVKLGAARSLLEIGVKLREAVELEAEVKELARRLDDLDKGERA